MGLLIDLYSGLTFRENMTAGGEFRFFLVNFEKDKLVRNLSISSEIQILIHFQIVAFGRKWGRLGFTFC